MADFILLLECDPRGRELDKQTLTQQLRLFCKKEELYAMLDDPYEFTQLENSSEGISILMARYYYENDMSPEETVKMVEEDQEDNVEQILEYLEGAFPGVGFKLSLQET